jgi:uncharacterized coiled-coil protein SlyX
MSNYFFDEGDEYILWEAQEIRITDKMSELECTRAIARQIINLEDKITELQTAVDKANTSILVLSSKSHVH